MCTCHEVALKTCHRAVFPTIMPYCCLRILLCYLYLVALHSTLSLNNGIVTLIIGLALTERNNTTLPKIARKRNKFPETFSLI